jgi:pimeloyl-ACP methyl ester carboxylesterase
MNEPTRTRLTINGIETAHLTGGSGPSVLLLHGWGAHAGLMWPLASALMQRGYHVLVPDMPGFGESALPPAVWTVYDYANFVCAYLDAQQVEQVHLIGHSFGGRLGLILGAEQATRIHKMVLIDAAGIKPQSNGNSSFRLKTYKAVRDGLANVGLKGLSDGLREWYTDRYGSADYKNAGPLRETFVKVVNEDLLPYASRVKPSTLLLWGEADADTPLWMAKQLESTIPDAGLHTFPGAGHYSYLERLPDTTRIIDFFFRQP